MSYLPRHEGETLEAWDARMGEAWSRHQPPTKTVAEMTPTERAAALAVLSKPAPAPIILPFEGAHVRDLSPHQRAQAARQLGISHLFPTFR